MRIAGLAIALWALVAQGAVPVAGSEDLTAAKALYASGAYEDALARLSALTAANTTDEVDQYRALCLLALGRTAEAQRSLETLVTRSPLFKMSETEVSPRLITMFHDVRKRLLPGAARDLYAKAKTSFEHQRYAEARPQLADLLVLLADEDMGDEAIALADLKLLGEGFLKLTDAELAASAKAAMPTVAPAAASGPPPVSIYSADDQDVKEPVDVAVALPPWYPPNPVAERQGYRGVLRIVIDETGKVESAVLVVPVTPAYDPVLLAAARQWQFRPALKNGEAVKYQKLIPIVLRPR
jgi:TonB family protein